GKLVTGVQTCALPISRRRGDRPGGDLPGERLPCAQGRGTAGEGRGDGLWHRLTSGGLGGSGASCAIRSTSLSISALGADACSSRSEERRVGKGCRGRG